MYFGKGIVMLFVHFWYLFVVFTTPLLPLFCIVFLFYHRHFATSFLIIGGKESILTKNTGRLFKVISGFFCLFFLRSFSLAGSGAVVLLWAYQLIIPGTVAFFWLVSSLFFWCSASSSCFFFISFTFHTTFLLHHIHNIIVQMILYIAEGIHILK